MASGGQENDSYNDSTFSVPPLQPPLTRNVSYGQEVSGSWMNLSQSFEQQESKLPRRASAIMATLKLKLAILSGGRDNDGRVIITFPARPRGTQYDHTQLLQTIQYLSTVSSAEARDLGFVIIVDGRLLSWADTKTILRTSQEALPGQIHIAYIIQPTQFVNKQQMSMGLSKEKDKIEFTIVKVSSVEKIVRHIDQRQVTFDLSGLLAYNHDEWLKIRTITEELLDAYQDYLVSSSQIESRLKPTSSLSPERTSELQNEMSQLEAAKVEIDSADKRVKEMCVLLRNEVESNSGSVGMTPEMVNCVATVERIMQNTEQHQTMLRDTQEQNYLRLKEIFSLKQFELGLAKVSQWIKTKGMAKVLRVDIGDSIPKVLTIQDDLKKLQGKAEAVANDVIELRRISDMMNASEHYAKDSVKERLKKVNMKYMKFKTALDRRKTIVTTSVAMYKGINEWRQVYEEYTGAWNDVALVADIDTANDLLLSLETQHSSLKEMAQKVLTQGQELVKCLKNSPVAQGDPDFRKSLRFISRVTEEVMEKLRKCHELAAVRRAKLDQYVHLLVCEKDGNEAITNLKLIQETLLSDSYGGVGTSGETLSSIVVEVEQHEDEIKRNHEYGRRLLMVAHEQRGQLNDQDTCSQTLLTELDEVHSIVNTIVQGIKERLHLGRKLFSVYDSTQATVERILSNKKSMLGKEKECREALSSLKMCKNMIVELRDRLKNHPLAPSTSTDHTHNTSINESLKTLDHLLHMIEDQQTQLTQAHSEEHKADSLPSFEIEGKLISMEQIIEDILIWLREYGLSQFTEFLSLGFTLTTVQDQWNEFCAFRETCQGLTNQVDDLENSIDEIANNQQQSISSGGEEIAKTTKRVKDLNRVWRKFLIRVQNREVVLSSLQQFLHGSVTLASMMSEALKSGQFQENLPVFTSSYHSAVHQGNNLVSLLKDSPDGTHDSQIVDRVLERMKQLATLHQQCQSLVKGTDQSTSSSASKTDEVVSPMPVKSDLEIETESDDVFIVTGNEKDTSTLNKSAKQQFDEMGKALTVLHEEFSISLEEFLQHHNVFPSIPVEINVELKQHKRFLELKRRELEQLSNNVSILRSHAVEANVPDIQFKHILNQIEKKLPNQIELLEKRIKAFQAFSTLNDLRTECSSVNEDVELYLARSQRDKITNENLQDILKTCSSLDKRVQLLTITCSEKIREFNELSPEIEMRTIEAKKNAKQIRQEMDDSAYRFSHSLKRRRKELEGHLKADDIETKLLELISWVGDEGMPGMASITVCTCASEAEKSLEDLNQLGSKGEVIDNEVKAIVRAVESFKSSDLNNLLKMLEAVYSEWKGAFKSKLEALNATVEFFIAAETLKEELESASAVNGSSKLNPSVIEKLYTVLRKQAENIQSMGNTIAAPTISAINENLKQVEELVNSYLQIQSPTAQEVSFEYSMLDNFLQDIQKEVQDVIDSVQMVDSSAEKETTVEERNLPQKSPSPKKPQSTFGKHKPLGTGSNVSSLKRLFEPANSTITDPSSLNNDKTTSSPLNENWPLAVNTYPPKRRLSSSSTVIKESPSKVTPESPLKRSVQMGKESARSEDSKMVESKLSSSVASLSGRLDGHVPVVTPDPSIVVVKSKEAPIRSTITINIQSLASAPTTPPAVATPPPVRPPLPLVENVTPESSDMDTNSYRSTPPPIRPPLPLSQDQLDTPPPIRPPLPLSQDELATPPLSLSQDQSATPLPVRPPLPLSQDQSILFQDILATPPPIRPPPPLSQNQSATPPPIRPPLPLSQDLLATPPPIRPSLPLSQDQSATPLSSQDQPATPPPIRPPFSLSQDESSQELFSPMKYDNRSKHAHPNGVIVNNSQESVEDFSSLNPESLHSTYTSENSQEEGVTSSDHTHHSQEEGVTPSNHTDHSQEEGVMSSDHTHYSHEEEGVMSSDHTHHSHEEGVMSSDHTHHSQEEGVMSSDHTYHSQEEGVMSSDHTYHSQEEEEGMIPSDQTLHHGLSLSPRTPSSQLVINEEDIYYSDYLGNEYGSVNGGASATIQNGYYDQLTEMRMEESTRPRDLSPVLEETSDEEDNPDIGRLKRKKQTKYQDVNRMELSRAHKQSLLSMKAVIRNFYEDEVMYSDILFKLIETYAPVLQHTGIFDSVYPIAEFQRDFLAKLNQSMATVPELCACFQQNLDNFKLYFPFVLGYDEALHIITSINPDELAAALLTKDIKISESDLIMDYTAPYHRLEVYCSLFQQLLRAAFKEDLMNLEALSETLEYLLDLLRILAMELATTKLTGCPFPVQATDVLAMNPFLVHLANKVKDVFLYTVFLHPHALVISERHLDDSKEHTLYNYIMHIPVSGMVLVENFRGLSDRFAVCEKGQISTENFVVFRSCDDISVKDFWVSQINILLQKEGEELTPRETLKPEQVDEIGHMIPNTAPQAPGANRRLEPLRKRKSLRRQKRMINSNQRDDTVDGFQTPESPIMENVYQVIMDHKISDGPLAKEYLSIKEGDLVEVLEMEENNYYCVKFPLDSDEEGEEGFIPACCVRPLPYRIPLHNHNSNNNIHEKRTVIGQPAPLPDSVKHPSSSTDRGKSNLEEDWSEFCSRTGRFEPFPDCVSEQELLNAKLDSLVRHYSDYHPLSQSGSRQAGMDQVGIDTPDDGRLSNERSDTVQESARRHLYSAPFLGYTGDEEPSYAQLNGVFSLKHPYASIEEIVSDNEFQIGLRKGQLVVVLDSKRDDWWLVSTFTEGDLGKMEGWVKRVLLQHAEYIREDVMENSSNPSSAFSIQLWLTLAKYNASDEGTISINEGELVKVIDNSRNKWSLVKTLGTQPREGWIPTEYIIPYNFSDNEIPTSPISPGVSVHPSIRVDDSMSSTEGNYDFTSIMSPTMSLGELDSEEKRKEALEKRECALMELYTTEKEYIDRLEYCITNYKQPIQSANSSAPRPLKLVVQELFTNIEEIHRFHKEEMLPRIESSQNNPIALVDLFSIANLPLKNLYVTYCKGQQKSESIFREFTDYIKELSSKLKDRFSLRDYLILPVQRITKYNLLLKSIHEYSIKSGNPLPHFQTTLGAAQEISRQANNSVHMSMIEITQRKLAEFGKLVLQDEFEYADQMTARGQFKRRRAFLFERCLVIAKSKKESPERESYVIRESFLLSEISLGEDHDSATKNIVIYEMVSGNKFILKAHSSKTHEEWLKMANELASLSKKLFMASSLMQQGSGGIRSRSLSEPLDMLPPYPPLATSISNSPSIFINRQGSQRLRRSAKNMNRPQSAVTSKVENFEPGTIFVVMEKIVPQGVEDFELEPGEEVELIKNEANGLLNICTTDENRLTGTVPSGYLRHKDLVKDNCTAPKITRHLTDLSQYIYDNILISCAFNGFPEPSIEWVKKDGETVVNSDRIKISSCPTSSVLEIRDLQYSDEGEYICRVSNELGGDETLMDLYIEGPPVPPSKPTASKISQSSVRLKWNPPDHDGHSVITYYTVELLREGFGEWQPIVQQPKTSFVVKTLNSNTWYQFRVIACNDNGESRPSEPSDIISTSKGRGLGTFVSPAPKRKLTVDFESVPKGSEDIDHGGTETGQHLSSPSHEDLTSPGSLPDTPSHGYHMIRHSSVGSVYDLADEVGRGRYGILHKCINKTTGNIYCAKYLKQTELAKNEVKTLHGLCRGKMCDNLVQWVDAVQTDINIVIIMECIEGGEMIDQILKMDCLTEGAIVSYLKQLLKALGYIHEKKIIHCDIKPENIMLTGEDWSTLKLIDFGSAHHDQSQSTLPIATLAHSLEFCAPEIINKHTVTTFADMWSVGVLTYILLSGMSPFFVDNTEVLIQKVIEISFDFNHSDFQQVSPEAKDFVAMLLKRNPTQRLSAQNSLQHSWIKTLAEAYGRCSTWSGPGIDLDKLKVFHARRKLQTSLIATKASSIFRSHTPSHTPSLSPTPLSTNANSTNLAECQPILEEGTEEVQTPINANITLEWLFTGHPTPSIVWEHKERKVVPSGRVRISTESGITRLHINRVVKADEGVYTCCALNSIGCDIQECRVIVLDKPSAPYGVTGVLLESTSAMVSWSTPLSTGNSAVTHYILEMRRMEYDQWELVDDKILGMAQVINGILPGAVYVFRVAAVNYIGVSEFSKPSAPIHIHEEEGMRSDSPYMLNEASMKKTDVDQEYIIRDEIGRGAYSIVYECTERSTDRIYAAKCIPKELESHALSEFECLRCLNHPRIVKLEEAFDMPSQTVLILEYVSDGELSHYVSPSTPLDEARAARFTRHITEGLQYLHDLGFIHANLSPKHLLLSSGKTDIKIAGFSCAHEEHNYDMYSEEVPVLPEYHSPESLESQRLSHSTDMWSLGSVILFMLTGHPPFHASNLQKLIADISSVSIYSECNNSLTLLSDDCYDIVFKGLLIINPRKRLSSHQCQRHRWLQNIGVDNRTESMEGSLTPPPGTPSATTRHSLQHMNTVEQVQYFLSKYQQLSSTNSSS